MGSTYKSPRVIRPGQSIFIATPAYELVKPSYAFSLAITTSELTKRGIPFQLAIMQGNCHVDDGRNSLVADFLNETQCTDLVFLDSDLYWGVESFLQLISHDTEDIVAGAYPYKSWPKRFPVGKILNAYPDGLLEMSYAPTGFMRIPRTVFEKLISTQTKRGGKNPTYRFFERRYTERTYDGGDVTFCRKWIAAGGKVIVDPRLKLGHVGDWQWDGCFLDYLAKDEHRLLHTLNSKDPVPEYKPDHPQEKRPAVVAPFKPTVKGSPVGTLEGETLQVIRETISALITGDFHSRHFKTLADTWGNKPWAATADYLEVAFKMAAVLPEGSTVLECGSGISTIVLAIAAKLKKLRLITLDHLDEWQGNVQSWLKALPEYRLQVEFPSPNIKHSAKWYDYVPNHPIDFIVIDGPPHYMGTERLYPLRQPWIGLAQALIDDASSNCLEQLKSIQGRWIPAVLGGRPACAGQAGVRPATEPDETLSAA